MRDPLTPSTVYRYRFAVVDSTTRAAVTTLAYNTSGLAVAVERVLNGARSSLGSAMTLAAATEASSISAGNFGPTADNAATGGYFVDVSSADTAGTSWDAIKLSLTLPAGMSGLISPVPIRQYARLAVDASGNASANTMQLAGQTVMAAAGVTFPSTVGTSNFAGGAVASVTGAVMVGTNNDKTGYALSTAGVTAVQLGLATSAALSSVQTALNALANMTDTSLAVPAQIVVPDAGTRGYKIRAVFTDADSNNDLINMTSTTLTITSATGTNRSSRVGSATNLSTGVYEWTYTSTAGDAEEGLIFDLTGTNASAGVWRNAAASQTINAATINFNATDRTRLNAVWTALPAGGAVIATPGDAMTLTAGERTSVGTAVWATTTRSLTTFGTLVSDIVTGVWGAATRVVTGLTGYVAPDNAGIAAIKGKTDALPASPASTGDVQIVVSGGFLTADRDTLGTINTSVGAMFMSVASLSTATSTMGGNVQALLDMTSGAGTTRAFRGTALANAPAGGGGGGGDVINFDDAEVTLG